MGQKISVALKAFKNNSSSKKALRLFIKLYPVLAFFEEYRLILIKSDDQPRECKKFLSKKEIINEANDEL